MSDKMRLFNRGDNHLPNDISLAGLPLFNDDLVMLQSNAFMYGLPSILKGVSCILSGCYVDDLNTSTKKMSITAGVVMIDDVIYNIPAITNQTYPFSIIAGSTSTDSRMFQDGNLKDVSVEYNYAIKTSFTFTNILDYYPSNLTSNEIYFDPFSAQRVEWILNNLNNGSNELLLTVGNFASITKTQTGKNIIGGSLSANLGSALKWKYMGYYPVASNAYLKAATVGSGGSTGGRNTFTLSHSNLPPLTAVNDGNHRHDFKNAYYAESDSVNIDSRVHRMTINNRGDISLANISGGGYQADNDNKPFAFDDAVNFAGSHTHNITGNNGQTLQNTSINLDPAYLNTVVLQWRGYNNQIPTNQYKFWNSVIPFPNM